jgi:hypothetical protein
MALALFPAEHTAHMLRRYCLNCRKSINKSGPGFGYGFIVAFCFTLAFFCLLCGLVLDGFQDVVKNQLESCESLQGACVELPSTQQRIA